MGTNFKDNWKIFTLDCQCMDIDHMIRFSYIEENREDMDEWTDGDLYFDSSLDAAAGFFTRLVRAFKYLFKLGGTYNSYMFGESIFHPSDVRDLIQFLQKYYDYVQKNELCDK